MEIATTTQYTPTIRFSVLVLALFAFLRFTNAQVDYFPLAQTWPPGYCQIYPNCQVPPPPINFTVHGLWPQAVQGGYMQPSNRLYYSFNDPNYVHQLGIRMPNLKNLADPHSFWEQEWIRHGRFSVSILGDQKGYFDASMQLKDDYDLLRIITVSGIAPGNPNGYRASRYEFAIRRATTGYPVIKCVRRTNSIREVVICTDSGIIRDCPSPTFRGCSGNNLVLPS